MSLLGAAALLLAFGVPAAAAPPTKSAENFTLFLPDEERRLVIFLNTTRAEYCTAGVVAWEEAVAQWTIDYEAWLEGGEVGPEPPFPDEPVGGFPEGNDPILTQIKETGQGALVRHQRAKGLVAEIWPMVEDASGVGPCTDTDAGDTPLVGTGRYHGNDNDLFASGTRGNAYGDRGTITGQDADGNRFTYSWRFHVNSRCYAPEDGPPACLIATSSFR
jgi:hypothetical protein